MKRELLSLDNDGDEDLVAVLDSRVVVQANDGTGKFAMKAVVETPSSLFSLNAVDYDNDLDLDLYVCAYTLATGTNHDDVFANPVPFQDANNGAPNLLLRNDGSWKFTDVTESVGLGQNNMRFRYASSWDGFDGDGDLDLYAANDFGRKNLYRNNGGTFTDVAAELGVEDIGPGMSACWASRFDVLQKSILFRQLPLPLPCSFLIDGGGRFRVLYKGPVSAAQLLADTKLLDASRADVLAASVPGKWLGHPGGTAPNAIAIRFIEGGFVKEAEAYLRQLIAAGDESDVRAGRGLRASRSDPA